MAVGYGLMIMLNERSSMYLTHLPRLKLYTILTVFPSALQIIYPLIAGVGLGGLFLPPLIGLQAAMPVKDMATSSTTFGLFRWVRFHWRRSKLRMY
jgi:hypothetical protein